MGSGSEALRRQLTACVGSAPVSFRSLGGGWASVQRVSFADGRNLVIKASGKGGLALEGQMLIYLAENSALPVPKVHFSDDTLLVMDWLEGQGGIGPAAEAHAAELIADLHTRTQDHFGLAFDTLIGPLHQPNPENPRWLPFFRDHRLRYMAAEATRAGRLPERLRDRIERLSTDLERWIDEPAAPALLHGDLWGGNVLAGGPRIAGFIDPAIYYGDPEIELAFSTLFGTFGDAFFDRYRSLNGLDKEWYRGFVEVRRDLYNLYPLLVHVRLFGAHYVHAVDRILGQFGV